MVSRDIDSTLKPYLAAPYRPTTATGTFGVGYESEKVFALFMPSLGITGYEAKAYVLGMETRSWTTWSFPQPRICGRIDPFSDTAYYGIATNPYLVKDRNSSSLNDYIEGEDGSIISTVQWAATTFGAPYATKQAREIHAHFRDVRKTSTSVELAMDWSIKTDIAPNAADLIPLWTGASLPTASSGVIGPAVLPVQFRKLIPQEVQRATYYTLSLSAEINKSYWALNGYSIVFESTSERTGTVR
jgi:hypothetical protein